MLKFYSLSSGSSGNCSFIRYKDTKILIDCGISAKKITNFLYEISEDSVDAILITHEHSDHVQGLKVFSSKTCVPVFATSLTWEIFNQNEYNIAPFNQKISVPGNKFSVGEIDVIPFNTSHDSVFSVGYNFFCGDKKLSVATDNGKITTQFAENLKGCYAALIEANFDTEMLMEGKYPYSLKKRILSPTGHMSNQQAACLACALARSGTKHITLGHLSKDNNTPDLAYSCVLNMLKKENLSVDLKVAERYSITKIL